MKLAIAEAKDGIKNGHGGPFGAVVVKDGEVVASGHNCVLKNNDSTCHGDYVYGVCDSYEELLELVQ